MEEERSLSLLQLMVNEGLVPSPEEEENRKIVIEKLKQIVVAWVKRVAWQRRLPKQDIAASSATLLTYGSYGLGVHGSESDIDALCVGPYFATIVDDFFIVLYNMLKSRPEVSEIHCVKDAKVPLMRFEFDGISIDLPFVQLKVLAVPENLDILNPVFLRDIDETGWKSLSGVLANTRICRLVPDLELNGFLGGIHLAILAAFVCQCDPHAGLSALISHFFKTFAFWPWPRPVELQEGTLHPTLNPTETRLYMPIRLPFSPYEYCHSNITKSTFYKIRTEFLRGHNLTKDLLKFDFDWHNVLEPFPYTKKYARFLKIFLSASKQDELGDWVGWIKSRFRCLLFKLEEVQGLCDPNPAEHIDVNIADPHVIFYWGLQAGKTNAIDIKSVKDVFWRNISTGYQGPFGKMELSIVQASQVPKSAQFDTLSRKRTKACWKMMDYHQRRIPIYSQHVPQYIVGYVSTNGDPEYPNAGV
ncbi:Poly (A) polymerase [Gossypium arboreum]|uniref:polynucleotide adenylyltransferase n=1 Tax=Gossypium arboreum TaxID=29729 RepID=A0A0B0PB78_GOSAR|nr:Poly (A) polymerase [Gossypium arboreum]